jgi:hypothetical protein
VTLTEFARRVNSVNVTEIPLLAPISLQQHNAFAADLNATPALRTTHDIVEPNHVVASILEARAILFICPTRQRWFLRATNPPDLVFPNCLATGTV